MKVKDSLVPWVTLRVTCIVLAKLSTCLAVLEAAVLRRTEAVSPCRRAEVLVITLLGRVLSSWLAGIALIWRLLAVLALRSLVALLRLIATLLRRVALAVAGLLVALVVALLAVLIGHDECSSSWMGVDCAMRVLEVAVESKR